jgi:hypothetical protein
MASLPNYFPPISSVHMKITKYVSTQLTIGPSEDSKRVCYKRHKSIVEGTPDFLHFCKGSLELTAVVELLKVLGSVSKACQEGFNDEVLLVMFPTIKWSWKSIHFRHFFYNHIRTKRPIGG